MNDELTQMEKNLQAALRSLVDNVLEDVPREHMSKHLIHAIEDAREMLGDFDIKPL